MEQNIQVGDVIEITLRKCSDKVQGNISVGSKYKVLEIGSVKSGATKLLLSDPHNEKKTYSVNADRFEWIKQQKDVSSSEAQNIPAFGSEDLFKMKVAWETKQIMNNFSFEEHCEIAFIPLIIAQTAWIYADKVLKYVADNRMSIFVKLSRATKGVRDKYYKTLAIDLKRDQIERINTQTELWLQECSLDFTIFYYTINREFLKHDYEYNDMRSYAIMTMIILDEWTLQNKKLTEMIRKKLGSADEIPNPLLDSLRCSMDAYAGNIEDFDFHTNDIENCRKIFRKNLKKIEFDLSD